MAGEHMPCRPTWECRACGLPWPCAAAQADMRDEYEGAGLALAIYLSGCLADAIRDLRGQPAPDLDQRFMGWRRNYHA